MNNVSCGRVWKLLGVTVVVAVLGAAGCNAGVEEEEPVVEPEVGIDEPTTGIAGPEVAADIEDIAENPAIYDGRTVTLSGEVEETYTPGRAFSMTGSGLVAENQIMVLVKGTQAVEEGRTVQATGTVRSYAVADLEEFEADLGWDFDEALEAELERIKAVLVADTVTAVAAAQP